MSSEVVAGDREIIAEIDHIMRDMERGFVKLGKLLAQLSPLGLRQACQRFRFSNDQAQRLILCAEKKIPKALAGMKAVIPYNTLRQMTDEAIKDVANPRQNVMIYNPAGQPTQKRLSELSPKEIQLVVDPEKGLRSIRQQSAYFRMNLAPAEMKKSKRQTNDDIEQVVNVVKDGRNLLVTFFDTALGKERSITLPARIISEMV